jgi:hypothetical protein
MFHQFIKNSSENLLKNLRDLGQIGPTRWGAQDDWSGETG